MVQKPEIPHYEAVYKPLLVPKREFRGVWIASIANIDWPSRRALSTQEQKSEFSQLAENMKNHGMNALLVQVRAATDAFYAKSAEPWSEWLMGKQGIAPNPYYDPMDFMIKESHARGMEFHAWLNLNRGRHKNATSIVDDHLINRKPEWFLSYDGYTLFNFGLPAVRNYIKDIVVNIVREYDVDGIHFDDYFYPYKVTGQSLKDEATFRQYPNGFRDIEDWRRNNIDLIVKDISEAIAAEKPWVKFGISPFGVWRNKSDDPRGSDTRGGQPSYDLLYADTKKWAEEGWIDYIAPQIYFPFEHRLVPYGTLTDWWAQNHGKAHLYIGHGMYRVDEENSTSWKDPNQIVRQIDYNRYSKDVTGSIFFSANGFAKNKLGVADSIKTRYQTPALAPLMPWKSDAKVEPPKNFSSSEGSGQLKLSWTKGDAHAFVLYKFEKGEELNLENPFKILSILADNQYVDKSPSRKSVYVLTALDRYKNESSAVFLEN